MVYKKYIKRGGKIFGPYYYESYRDENGIVKTRYINRAEESRLKIPKIPKLVFLVIGIFLGLLLAGFFFRIAYVIYSPNESFFIGDVKDFSDLFDEDLESFALTGDSSEIYLNYSFGNLINLRMDPGFGMYNISCFNGEAFEEFILIDEKVNKNFTIPNDCQDNLQIKIEFLVEYEDNESVSNDELEVNETILNKTEQEANETINGTISPETNETEQAINKTEQEANETINGTISPETNETEQAINKTEQEANETISETISPETNETEQAINEIEENDAGVVSEVDEETIEESSEGGEESVEEFEEQAPITGEVVSGNFGKIFEITVYRIDVKNKKSTFTTKQYRAVIGRPVKWIKIVKAGTEENISLEIPKKARDIVVKTGNEVDKALKDLEDYNETIKEIDKKEIVGGRLTGAVINFNERRSFFEKLFGITGRVIRESELEDSLIEIDEEKIINVSKIIEETGDDDIAVEYYTDAPKAVEEPIEDGKRVIIIGPDEIHYEDVLAYSELDNKISLENIDRIKLYWYENGTEERKEAEFDAYDLDEDGMVDYIEWIVPHLSEQVYEIIYITKAEHLDSNRNFVEDITDYVRMPDDIWSPIIGDGEYVRVEFEVNLTPEKDITLYARGSGSIDVFVKNSSQIVAHFDEISDEGFYRVSLSELEGSWKDFDLKVNGEVSFDWIVDPSPVIYGAPTSEVYTCGNITASGIYTMNQSILGEEVLHASSNGCIDIQAPNVYLDCGGFAIYDTSSGHNVIYSNYTNTTIYNCYIDGDLYTSNIGVYLDSGADKSQILNSEIYNFMFNIYLNSVDGINITNGYFPGSLESAIYAKNSNLVNVSSSTFVSNAYNSIRPGSSSTSWIIENNRFSGSGSEEIWISDSSGNIISKNEFANSHYGITLSNADYNTIAHNNFTNCIGNCFIIDSSEFTNLSYNIFNGSESYLISLSGSHNNLNNFKMFNASGGGISILSGNDNNLTNISILSQNSQNPGIYSAGYNTSISNCTIRMSSLSGGKGIELFHANFSRIYNNTLHYQNVGLFINRTAHSEILNNSLLHNNVAIKLREGSNNSVNENILLNNTHGFCFDAESVSEINATDFDLELENVYGSISWTNSLTFNSTNLSAVIKVSNYSVFVDSVSVPALNTSARISFYDTDALGYSERWPLRNGENCSSSICTVIQDADTYIFDVAHFTNYSIGGRVIPEPGEGVGGEETPDCGDFNNWCNWADANQDGKVNILDLIFIRNNLGGVDCGEANNWCNGADTNRDGFVTIDDLIYSRDVYSGGGSQISPGEPAGEPEEVEIPIIETESGHSNYECEEWGECIFEYNFDDLIKGVDKIMGKQKRVCRDKSGIGKPLIQTQRCFVSVDIYVKEEEFCNENYLLIYDKKTDKLVGRILDDKESDNPRLNIEFLDKIPEYCEYCFNGIKDGDETGVDCGGSCAECIDYSPYSFSLFDRIMGFLGF